MSRAAFDTTPATSDNGRLALVLKANSASGLLAVTRFYDALIDPLIDPLSDRSEGRRGRRRW